MGMLFVSKGAESKEYAWSMRTNVMYGLFDLGRLIIDDERKLHAFHNEIAALCNTAYDRVKRDVEVRGVNEITAVRGHFGIDPEAKPCSSLMAGLNELLTFMYGENDARRQTVNGFLQRAQALIDAQFRAHYEDVAGGECE
jgi:hypothetical protein